MLAALLCNIPIEPTPPQHARGGGGGYRRRPNEKIKWHDNWIKEQEELSKFKALPVEEKKIEAEKAVKAIAETKFKFEGLEDAQDIIDNNVNILITLYEIEIVMMSYYDLLNRQRQNNIAAMLLLGVL